VTLAVALRAASKASGRSVALVRLASLASLSVRTSTASVLIEKFSEMFGVPLQHSCGGSSIPSLSMLSASSEKFDDTFEMSDSLPVVVVVIV